MYLEHTYVKICFVGEVSELKGFVGEVSELAKRLLWNCHIE